MKRVLLFVFLILIIASNVGAITALDATKPAANALLSTVPAYERETRAKVNEIIAGATGLPDWKHKTANYTAINGDKILADCNSTAFTITLPASPTRGQFVTIADATGTWASCNVTVSGGAEYINGLATTLVLSKPGIVNFEYVGAGYGWSAINSNVSSSGFVARRPVITDGNQSLTTSYANEYHLSYYNSYSDIRTAIGTDTATLIIDNNVTLGDNDTIPSGTQLRFIKGNKITLNGFTLKISDPPEAGKHQAFKFDLWGRVEIANPGIIQQEWFGSNAYSLYAAIDAAAAGSTIMLSPGTSTITFPIVSSKNLSLKGHPGTGTALVAGAGMAGETMLTLSRSGTSPNTTSVIEDIYLNCSSIADSGLVITNLYTSTINRVYAKNCLGIGQHLDATTPGDIGVAVVSFNNCLSDGNGIDYQITTNSRTSYIPHVEFNNCGATSGEVAIRGISTAYGGSNFGGYVAINGGMYQALTHRTFEFLGGPWRVTIDGNQYAENSAYQPTLRITGGGTSYPSNTNASASVYNGQFYYLDSNATDDNSSIFVYPGVPFGLDLSPLKSMVIVGKDYDARRPECYGSPYFDYVVNNKERCIVTGANMSKGSLWIDGAYQTYKATTAGLSGDSRWTPVRFPVERPVDYTELSAIGGAVGVFLAESNMTITDVQFVVDTTFTTSLSPYSSIVDANATVGRRTDFVNECSAYYVTAGGALRLPPSGPSDVTGYYNGWTLTFLDGNDSGSSYTVCNYDTSLTGSNKHRIWIMGDWYKTPDTNSNLTLTPGNISMGPSYDFTGTNRNEWISTVQGRASVLTAGNVISAKNNTYTNNYLGTATGKYVVGVDLAPAPSNTNALFSLFASAGGTYSAGTWTGGHGKVVIYAIPK